MLWAMELDWDVVVLSGMGAGIVSVVDIVLV